MGKKSARNVLSFTKTRSSCLVNNTLVEHSLSWLQDQNVKFWFGGMFWKISKLLLINQYSLVRKADC